MSNGICLRCDALGPVENDHPDGRFQGVPLLPLVVGSLCVPCHRLKGVIDRAAGVEGGAPTVRVVLARRASWLEFLATGDVPITLPNYVLRDLAHVLATASREVPADILWDQCDD